MDGTRWKVRVLGRGAAGGAGGALLLLGFDPADADADADDAETLEALVPGTALRDLPEHALQAGARRARPPNPERTRPLFPGTSGGRRDRRR